MEKKRGRKHRSFFFGVVFLRGGPIYMGCWVVEWLGCEGYDRLGETEIELVSVVMFS